MPLITFPTACYQETCTQGGGDLLIKLDVSHFSPTATCIQLQTSVWRLRSISSEDQMGRSSLIPDPLSLRAVGLLARATALQCPRVTSCPRRTLLFALQRQMTLFCTGTHFPLVVPSTVFFQRGVNRALEGPANCCSSVLKQALGRQLLPLEGYQRVLLTNTPSS